MIASAQQEEQNLQDQQDELTALQSIYDNHFTDLHQGGGDEPSFQYEVNTRLNIPSSLDICVHTPADTISFRISHFPPLRLQFSYPKEYPSSCSPLFAIKSSVLSEQQILSLQEKLRSMFNGSPVIFLWCDWLQENTFKWLGWNTPLELGVVEEKSEGKVKGIGVKDSTELVAVMEMLKRYDKQMNEFEFQQDQHTCAICFETCPGIQCLRLSGCNHIYCRKCMSQYFTVHITEGDIDSLKCPSCKQDITGDLVQESVPPALYERYRSLVRKKTLENRTDVVWCPRVACSLRQTPAFLIDAKSPLLAVCSECGHAFCSECKHAWHGIAHCFNLIDKFKKADEQEREALMKKYGAKVFADLQSQEWVVENSKACPRCRTRIEKNGGCNHMTCKKCNYEFCWICMNVYSVFHFSMGRCEQFSDEPGFEEEVEEEEEEGQYNQVVGTFQYNYRHYYNY